jgi:hypothetical protein
MLEFFESTVTVYRLKENSCQLADSGGGEEGDHILSIGASDGPSTSQLGSSYPVFLTPCASNSSFTNDCSVHHSFREKTGPLKSSNNPRERRPARSSKTKEKPAKNSGKKIDGSTLSKCSHCLKILKREEMFIPSEQIIVRNFSLCQLCYQNWVKFPSSFQHKGKTYICLEKRIPDKKRVAVKKSSSKETRNSDRCPICSEPFKKSGGQGPSHSCF